MMGLLIYKYEPFWHEVSVKSLIFRLLLRPVGILLGHICHSGDLLLWVGVHRRLSRVTSSQELLSHSWPILACSIYRVRRPLWFRGHEIYNFLSPFQCHSWLLGCLCYANMHALLKRNQCSLWYSGDCYGLWASCLMFDLMWDGVFKYFIWI